MNVDKHISALLYHHDCVIVTDFGGFVANYKPAFVNPSSHTISPPAKRIAFNGSLTQNDGLLAQYIAHQMQMSYSEACNLIKVFADTSMQTLHNGERLVLPQIGTLYLDAENHIRFEADTQTQYALQSFGLTTLQTRIIQRNEVVNPNYDGNEKRKWWQLLEVVPVAAILALLLLNGPSVEVMVNKNLMGFSPAKAVTNRVDISMPKTDLNTQPSTINSVSSNKIENVLTPAVNSGSGQITVSEPTTVTAAVIENKNQLPKQNPAIAAAKPTSTQQESVTPISNASYYIVAGCFKSDENATAYTKHLLTLGLNAKIIGKRNGLHVVTCFAGSKAETMAALEQIKTKVDAGVWVLKN
ncbi:MAG: hypothetical protein JNK61_09505 [Bacteroidia bacterium]|nr:hypothetical protein [Bacteroidia bacterium]